MKNDCGVFFAVSLITYSVWPYWTKSPHSRPQSPMFFLAFGAFEGGWALGTRIRGSCLEQCQATKLTIFRAIQLVSKTQWPTRVILQTVQKIAANESCCKKKFIILCARIWREGLVLVMVGAWKHTSQLCNKIRILWNRNQWSNFTQFKYPAYDH